MTSASPADAASFDRPTRVRWLVFLLACAASFLLYLHRYAWGVVKPSLKEDTGISDVALGGLDSAFSVTYMLCQVPGGMAGDVFGPRGVLSLITLLWSASLAWIGMAQGTFSVIAARLSFGAMQAGTYANLAKVTRSWFPLALRTFVQGAVSTFSGRLGAAAAPPIIASLLIGQFGLAWRTSLLLISALGIVLATAFWLVLRNSPAEHPWCNAAERESVSTVPAAGASRTATVWNRAGFFSFGALLVHSFTSTLPDMFYVNWIPTYLRDRGFSMVEMGMYASLPLLGGAVGGLFGGTLNDVLIKLSGNRRFSRTAVGLTGKVVSGGIMAWAMTLDDGRAVVGAFTLSKFFTDWSLPTQWAAVTDTAGQATGKVFGLMNTVGSAAGILAGFLIGYLKQYYGWDVVFYVLSIVYVVSGLCWLGIDCTKPLVKD
jgi:sugar phosphate permease